MAKTIKKEETKFALIFTRAELATSRVKELIRKLIELKLDAQKYNDFITICPAEFEILSKYGDFVDKERYNNAIEFKGEVGKMRGKRLVLKE